MPAVFREVAPAPSMAQGCALVGPGAQLREPWMAGLWVLVSQVL